MKIDEIFCTTRSKKNYNTQYRVSIVKCHEIVNMVFFHELYNKKTDVVLQHKKQNQNFVRMYYYNENRNGFING
jgi:hypothetical protein